MPGILSDTAIAAALNNGDIKIDPWDPAQLNPASYDLTLGDGVTVYRRWVSYDEDYDVQPKFGLSRAGVTGKPRDGSDLFASSIRRDGDTGLVLNVKEEPSTVSFKIDKDQGWILKPGIGYLMHTRERIWTEKFVPIVDGKSSIGRLFIQIHATAGYGDPGYDGEYTLEVIVQHPVRVYAGMRIGQIRFHTLEGEVEKTYKVTGSYKDEAAQGAVASKAWRQFK